MNDTPITAQMLFNHTVCPHRVTMDLRGDTSVADAISPFIQMLWYRQRDYAQEITSTIGPCLDLTQMKGQEKQQATAEAMVRQEPLIIGGQIIADDLVGEPAILRFSGHGYEAGDIKAGAGEDGASGDPKVSYGVQLGLYTDILDRLGLSAGHTPFVIDVHGEQVDFPLDDTYGSRNPRTLWGDYQRAAAAVRDVIAGTAETTPAMTSVCKMCRWRSVCTETLEAIDDLTLLPELGRSRRDTMVVQIDTVAEFAETQVDSLIQKKKTVFPGIGPDMLHRFHKRAVLTRSDNPVPYFSQPITLPHSDVEIFFDVETDPMRDICYLHGMLERRDGKVTFYPFFADDVTPEAEKAAFAAAYAFLAERPTAIVYYYSKYERTIWRGLQAKYPEVCSEQDIEDLFCQQRSVDLYYDVVQPATIWPTRDHSIKTLAKFLGFEWRDTDPSGAASIEWFDNWVRSGDPQIKQRILDYNEDDCVATIVLLDGLRGLDVLT